MDELSLKQRPPVAAARPPLFGSAWAQVRAVRTGDVSCRELVSYALERAEQTAHLGAFVSLQPELALQQAAAADSSLAQFSKAERDNLPPLFGLPTAFKDLVQVAGFVTTHGSAAVSHLRAAVDDPIVAQVRAAGAICIGKTQVPEFGITGYSENLIADPARNPHNLLHTAGGSTGGSAAALASGVVAAAVGSDGGGSIRIPAAACGLVGLKPGRDAVFADRVAAPPANGSLKLTVPGPMAHTALDAALLYDAISDAHPLPSAHPRSAVAAVRSAAQLRGLRIAVSFQSPFSARWQIDFDAATRDAVARAVARLQQHGHQVSDASFAYGSDYPEAFTAVWTHGLTRIGLTAEQESRLTEIARWFLERSRQLSPVQLQEQRDKLDMFAAAARAQWAAFDAVLTPALAHTAPLVGDFCRLAPADDYRLQCEWAPQTSMVNVVGVPAVAVPIAGVVDAAGLPRAVQLIGRQGSELQLLQLAAQLSA